MASTTETATTTHSCSHSTSALTLHIWPPYESALSLDPPCVAALLYLQTSLPGHFAVAHCNNPDASPSGQLPYLTHGLRSVASFSSIVKYVSGLEGATLLDTHLTATEKAQTAARVAHVEAELGDLVAHVYYALSTNWVGRTHPMLVSLLPAPQRYFLPKRIRESFRPRLEAVELWNAEGVADEEEEQRLHFSFRQNPKKNKKQAAEKKKRHLFARDTILDKARAFLDIYAKLLSHSTFFYNSEIPTVLDIVLAAHVHLLQQPLPDSLLRDLLAESYPQLLEHAHNVYDHAFNPALPTPPAAAHRTAFSFSSIIPTLPAFRRSQVKRAGEEVTEEVKEVQEVQHRFAMLRWGFFAVALVTLGVYLGFGDIKRQYVILSDVSERNRLINRRRVRKEREGEGEGDEDEKEGEEYEEDDEE